MEVMKPGETLTFFGEGIVDGTIAPSSFTLSFDSRTFLTINADGTMTPGAGLGMDEATQQAAKMLADHYGRQVTTRIVELEAEVARLREALEPFAFYAERRQAQPLKGQGDSVHSIHIGTEWEAHITLSDCIAARAALKGE